jgi:hypothetical protein
LYYIADNQPFVLHTFKYWNTVKANETDKNDLKINKIKMTYVYILIDEASVIMPNHADSKEVIAMKQEIIDTLCIFSKTCRSYGMFPIIATQKTVKDEIPSIIKDMSAVRVSFRANGGKSSESILGDQSAVGLLDRYAIYSLDGGCTKDYTFSPKLTTTMLNNMLKPHIDKKFKKIDIDTEISAWKENQPIQAKSVTPIKEKEKPKPKDKPKNSNYPIINIADNRKDDQYVDYE